MHSTYRYDFNAKEHQPELGLNWHDYHARNYDAALGRWMNVDPLGEEMPSWSPYNYAFNNPVFFIDPDGLKPESSLTNIFKLFKKEDGTYRAEKTYINNGNNNQIYLVMDDNHVAASMYQGLEAQYHMNKDGINISNINNGNTTKSVIKDAIVDFLTSDEFRTKNAREVMKNYVITAGIVLTGPAALFETGVVGLGAKASVLGSIDDLSGDFGLTSDEQTVIQMVLGKKNGDKVKTGLNILGVSGAATSILKNGVNATDLISGSLDVTSAIERNNKEK